MDTSRAPGLFSYLRFAYNLKVTKNTSTVARMDIYYVAPKQAP